MYSETGYITYEEFIDKQREILKLQEAYEAERRRDMQEYLKRRTSERAAEARAARKKKAIK